VVVHTVSAAAARAEWSDRGSEGDAEQTETQSVPFVVVEVVVDVVPA
jgi:hypothetical protein